MKMKMKIKIKIKSEREITLQPPSANKSSMDKSFIDSYYSTIF